MDRDPIRDFIMYELLEEEEEREQRQKEAEQKRRAGQKSSADEEESRELSYQMQEIAWDDAPWVFLWSLPQVYGVSNDVNYAPRPDGYLFPWEIGK